MQEPKRAIPEQPVLQFLLRDGNTTDIYSRKLLTKVLICLRVRKLDKSLIGQDIKSEILMRSQGS